MIRKKLISLVLVLVGTFILAVSVEMFILRICGRRGLRYDRNGKENLIPRPGRDLADTLEKEAVALPLARLLREDPAFK